MQIPNLGGGRLGGQGNMFVAQLIKLTYGPDKTIPLSVSFTYNAPVSSLKVKVLKNSDTSLGTLLPSFDVICYVN